MMIVVERTLTDLIGGLMEICSNVKYIITKNCVPHEEAVGWIHTHKAPVGGVVGSGENFNKTPPSPPNPAPIS